MPQFDVTSFFPQISFFAGVFLIFYVFLTKTILPKISQNLKLNKKLEEIFVDFSNLKDINLLSYIYNPLKNINHLICKENFSLAFMIRFGILLFSSFSKGLPWGFSNEKENKNKNFFKLNKTYLLNLNKII